MLVWGVDGRWEADSAGALSFEEREGLVSHPLS